MEYTAETQCTCASCAEFMRPSFEDIKKTEEVLIVEALLKMLLRKEIITANELFDLALDLTED